MPDLFISYSRRDIEFVDRLESALKDRGKDVWRDTDDIPPAAEFEDELHRGIVVSDAFVFVISDHSVASEYCASELSQAVQLGKRIVPLNYAANGAALPPPLGKLNWVPQLGRFEDDFERSLSSLIEAVETDLKWVRSHTERLEQAERWELQGRPSALLLRGSELGAAEQWVTDSAGKEPPPTEHQLAFIQASRKASTRRTRQFSAAVTFALVVAIVLAVAALIERSQAVHDKKLAVSRALSAESVEQRGSDPELSVLLARQALETEPTQQAQSALRQALLASFIRARITPATGADAAAVSGDGHLLMTHGGGDGRYRLWRLPDRTQLALLPAAISAASFAPSGANVLAQTRSGKVLLFDRLPNLTAAELQRSGAVAAQWSPDGAELAVAPGDGTVAVYRGSDGRQLALLHGAPPASSAALAIAGGVVALAAGPSVAVWDAAHAQHPRVWRLPSTAILLSPDGTRLLSDDSAGIGTATLWDTRSGLLVRNLGSVLGGAAAFSRTDLVALGQDSGAVETFSAATGQLVSTNSDHSGAVRTLDFSPNGAMLLSAGSDGTIAISDPESGKTLAELRGTEGGVETAAFTSDGQHVVSAGQDGAARLWSAGEVFPISSHRDQPVAVSPDGRTILLTEGSSAALVNRASGRTTPLPGTANQSGVFAGAAERFMLVASSSVSLWQVGSAAPMLTARHPGLLAGASAISPDGREIAVAWLHQGATAFVEIDRAGAARPVVLRANPEQMAFSADGTQLALASPSSPRALIYDAPSGRFERALVVAGGHSPADVTYARDAPRVAVSYAGGVQVFDQRTGQRVGPLLRNPLGNYAVALSADGRQVVAGGDTASDATGVANSEVLDWSLPSGTLLSTLVQGNNRSVSAQFSRDGRFVLTSTENDQTFVFEAATGDRLLQYPGANPSWDDSAHLIADTSVPDGPGPLYGYVWPCDVCTGVRGLIALANARVTRGFTPGERKKFLAGLT